MAVRKGQGCPTPRRKLSMQAASGFFAASMARLEPLAAVLSAMDEPRD
jgi:hypothetical protein